MLGATRKEPPLTGPGTPKTEAEIVRDGLKTAGILVALAVGAVAFIAYSVREGEPPTAQKDDDMRDEQISTAVLCEAAVQQRLRAPATAKFPTALAMEVRWLGARGYRLASHVDSQNGFGALLRTSFVCETEGQGSNLATWKVTKIELAE